MTVQRFGFVDDGGWTRMELLSDGDYVRYSDYAASEKRAESADAKLAALEAQCAGHKGEILDLVGLLHRTADELRCNYPDWAAKLDKLTEKTSSGTHLLARLGNLEEVAKDASDLLAILDMNDGPDADTYIEALEKSLAKVAQQPTDGSHQ
jgi:hypothetical protein